MEIACSLDGTDLADRRERWQRLADRALARRERTARGQRLVFRREDGVEGELRRLAELERECCAFADWSVEAWERTVSLDVGGSSVEAVAAVRHMFGTLPTGRG